MEPTASTLDGDGLGLPRGDRLVDASSSSVNVWSTVSVLVIVIRSARGTVIGRVEREVHDGDVGRRRRSTVASSLRSASVVVVPPPSSSLAHAATTSESTNSGHRAGPTVAVIFPSVVGRPGLSQAAQKPRRTAGSRDTWAILRPCRRRADKTQWRDLYHEVVITGLCTGCTACIVACPFHVLGYEDNFRSSCRRKAPTAAPTATRDARSAPCACPRFRDWEAEIDQTLFGMTRKPEELIGQYREICLARADAPEALMQGQDGGVVSALLIWGLATARSTAPAPRSSPTSGPGTPSPRSSPTRRRPRHGGLPLHLLREPAGAAQGRRDGPVEGRARGHGLPVERDGGDGGPPREQVAEEDRLDLRAAVLEVFTYDGLMVEIAQKSSGSTSTISLA